MRSKEALVALTGLSQESRLAIFRLLVQRGPEGMTPGEISEKLRIPASSLSFHLKGMTQAKLLNPKQTGRFINYTANFKTMDGLVAYLTKNCCGGNPCAPINQSAHEAHSITQ